MLPAYRRRLASSCKSSGYYLDLANGLTTRQFLGQATGTFLFPSASRDIPAQSALLDQLLNLLFDVDTVLGVVTVIAMKTAVSIPVVLI